MKMIGSKRFMDFIIRSLWVGAVGLFCLFQVHAQFIPDSVHSITNDNEAVVLKEGDVLQIFVFEEADLNGHTTVDNLGYAELPLIGAVPLAGQTVEDARATLKKLLERDYLVQARVSVTLVERNRKIVKRKTKQFMIVGHVTRPGIFEYPEGEQLELMKALAQAGGLTRLGSPSKITVRRVVDGEVKIFKLDADKMAKQKDSKPFPILPDDTITIGERLF